MSSSTFLHLSYLVLVQDWGYLGRSNPGSLAVIVGHPQPYIQVIIGPPELPLCQINLIHDRRPYCLPLLLSLRLVNDEPNHRFRHGPGLDLPQALGVVLTLSITYGHLTRRLVFVGRLLSVVSLEHLQPCNQSPSDHHSSPLPAGRGPCNGEMVNVPQQARVSIGIRDVE